MTCKEVLRVYLNRCSNRTTTYLCTAARDAGDLQTATPGLIKSTARNSAVAKFCSHYQKATPRQWKKQTEIVANAFPWIHCKVNHFVIPILGEEPLVFVNVTCRAKKEFHFESVRVLSLFSSQHVCKGSWIWLILVCSWKSLLALKGTSDTFWPTFL